VFTLINTGMYTINSYLDLGAGVSLVGG